MKNYWCWCVSAIVLLLHAGGLQAQPVPGIGANNSPAFSPYLNQLRNAGNSVTLNYLGIVQPNLQTNLALQNLNNDVNQNRQAIGNLYGGGLPSTGHVTQFMNYGGYFLNNGIGGAGAGFGGGGVVGGGGLGRMNPAGGAGAPMNAGVGNPR
jgi:hypothetical protein